MNKPWDIKSDDIRKVDSLPTFIIFCEDKVSEPIYFKFFETEKIKINTIPEQKSKIDNVVKAICYCKENNVFEDEGIHVWCVFDRDIENESEGNIREGNVKFDESIKTAKDKNFKTAWSNDSFELWILLHLEDIDITDAAYKNRKKYYDKLTQIFKSLPNPNDSLIKAKQGHSNFNYKEVCKSKNNFKDIVMPIIVNTIKDAIKRAKDIEKKYPQNIPSNEKAPCTMVHHLVVELLKLGEKQV